VLVQSGQPCLRVRLVRPALPQAKARKVREEDARQFLVLYRHTAQGWVARASDFPSMEMMLFSCLSLGVCDEIGIDYEGLACLGFSLLAWR